MKLRTLVSALVVAGLSGGAYADQHDPDGNVLDGVLGTTGDAPNLSL